MNPDNIRSVVLEVISSLDPRNAGSFQSGPIFRMVVDRLGIATNTDLEQVILTTWNDLFRTGHLSWGYDLSNPTHPFLHLTDRGRTALANFSRDPTNPLGYMAFLDSVASIPAVSRSLVEESLSCFNSDCFRAASVMIGCATEDIILDIRDTLKDRMTSLSKTPPSNLSNWQIKRVIDCIDVEISKCTLSPKSLDEQYQAYWSSFIGIIRMTRNDAGHPRSLGPVTYDAAHSSLLVFPMMAKLANELKLWIASSYS